MRSELRSLIFGLWSSRRRPKAFSLVFHFQRPKIEDQRSKIKFIMPAFLLSAIGPIVGGIASAIGSVVSTISSVLQTAAQLVMSAVQTIAKGLMVVGGLVVKGAVMFANVMMKVVQNAMAYAKSVNDLRLSTGMGMKEAGATSMKFGAFGISPQMLAQGRGNEHHSITKMRAAAWGVDPNDPMSINRKARSFGDSLAGHAQREAMLESVGMNNDKGRWMASLSEEQMQDQMNFTQKTGAAMGISPESMSKMAEALPLAQAKLESFLQLVQLKFVDSALPLIERGVAMVSDFVTANAPVISQTLTEAFDWIFTEGPVIVMNGVQSMLDTFMWLSNTFFNVAHTVVAFLKTLESADSGLGGFVVGFLNVIDNVINTLQFLSDVWHNFMATIANLLIHKIRMIAGLASNALKMVGQGDSAAGKAAATLAKTEYEPWRFHGENEKSKLAANFQAKQKTGDIGRLADDMTKGLNKAQTNVNDAFSKVQGVTTTVSKAVKDNKEVVQGNKQADENNAAIRKATEKTADNTDPKRKEKANTPAMQDWLGRFAMERSRQRYLMETR